MQELLARVKGWASKPFTQPLDLTSFVLLVMLAVTVAYCWTRVITHVYGER